MDLIFLGQEAIHGDQQGMDLTVDEARDIIGDWPLSFSSIPADVFHRYVVVWVWPWLPACCGKL